MLKNILSEERIPAIVINGTLEGGAGVDVIGWSTAARVVVAEADAERARPIAVRFDHQPVSRETSAESAEPKSQPAAEVPADWPRCPECGQPRATDCPVCHTEGTAFRPADAAPLDVLAPGAAAETATSCSCALGGCASAGAASKEETPGPAQDEPESAAKMLLCPTCDEPFVPEYRRICLWCNHHFADGYEPDLAEELDEPINLRVIAAFVGMLVVLGAISVYLMWLF
jgi:hypothetical protein